MGRRGGLLFPDDRTVTITVSAATSDAEDVRGKQVVAIRTPSTYDGTTLTFTCSDTETGTFDTIYKDDGTAYTLTLAASRYTAVDYTKFVGVNWLKLVAGTNQTTTDTIVTLYVRPM